MWDGHLRYDNCVCNSPSLVILRRFCCASGSMLSLSAPTTLATRAKHPATPCKIKNKHTPEPLLFCLFSTN